jgi:pyruvate kinase
MLKRRRGNPPALVGASANAALTLKSGEGRYARASGEVPPSRRPSALNLAHYLIYRDLVAPEFERLLYQAGLAPVREPLSILEDLRAMGDLASPAKGSRGFRDMILPRRKAELLLERRTGALLGPGIAGRRVRIMVNAPDSAAHSPDELADLLEGGMSALRINCARGTAKDWSRIIGHLRRAEKRTGRKCRLFMDLAGTKIRTTVVEQGRGGEKSLRVKKGDRFLLTGDSAPLVRGVPGVAPVRVGVTMPELLGDVRTGHRVLIDDGKIVGRVTGEGKGWVEVQVVEVRERGRRLRGERSVNLPDSQFQTPDLTVKDEEDLRFAAAQADMIGLSFVREPRQIARVMQRLRASGGTSTGIVVKIENAQAVRNLPGLLFEALKWRRAGLLIARGDLAAECGFEAIAALQQEAVRLAHAAHLPVILATQVMEQMVQEGMPSRAEMGDVANAGGIECLLLNKGAHVGRAVRFLAGVLNVGRTVEPSRKVQ